MPDVPIAIDWLGRIEGGRDHREAERPRRRPPSPAVAATERAIDGDRAEAREEQERQQAHPLIAGGRGPEARSGERRVRVGAVAAPRPRTRTRPRRRRAAALASVATVAATTTSTPVVIELLQLVRASHRARLGRAGRRRSAAASRSRRGARRARSSSPTRASAATANPAALDNGRAEGRRARARAPRNPTTNADAAISASAGQPIREPPVTLARPADARAGRASRSTAGTRRGSRRRTAPPARVAPAAGRPGPASR